MNTSVKRMRTAGDFEILDETPIYNSKSHCTMLKCKCKCGEELYVNKYTLDSGQSLRCRKCFGKTLVGQKNPNFRGYRDIPSSIITRSKRRAKASGIEWKLDIKTLYSMYIKQNKKCAITNLPISFLDKTASLDRISSSGGYTEDNVWWVHKDVNIMKNGYELGYFAHICGLASKNLKQKDKHTNFVYGRN